MTIYKKLVRDRIPQMIKQAGKSSQTRVLSVEEYQQCLRAKLQEEVEEYLSSHQPEELADILEVIYAIAHLHGLPPAQLELLRLDKAKERGAFDQRIFLESVE
jgi:predicted house-cleaning noncanonical NTP pyrophosphatase (MazG superfamily)